MLIRVGVVMTMREVRLTEALDRFIEVQVASGSYEDASDVMREALRVLELQKREDQARLAYLREAIAEGDASGIFEGDPFEHARAVVGLPPTRP